MLVDRGQVREGGRRLSFGTLRTVAQVGTIAFSAYNIVTDHQNILRALREGVAQALRGLDVAFEGLLTATLGLAKLLLAASSFLLPLMALVVLTCYADPDDRKALAALGGLGLLLAWLFLIPRAGRLAASGFCLLVVGGKLLACGIYITLSGLNIMLNAIWFILICLFPFLDVVVKKFSTFLRAISSA